MRPVQLIVFSPRVEFNFVENLEFHMAEGAWHAGDSLAATR